ncbi:MAG: SET domain-containing protein-lysine N-methyltransferase [Rhizobiales bacterium]|nr:SET domain-containing protein-lysine N-methyltransferase [Hyphomicrobiales bacterium]
MDAKPYRVGRSHTGLGLFATMPIRKHALIVEYSGPRIPTAEAHARERAGRSKYMFEINRRWTIDGAGRDNMGRYVNHACQPNAESVLIRGKIFLKAIRRIHLGEEITYDYGREYVELFFKDGCKCAACRAR